MEVITNGGAVEFAGKAVFDAADREKQFGVLNGGAAQPAEGCADPVVRLGR